MKTVFVTAAVVVGLATSPSAQAVPPAEAPCVLLGLDIHMGAVTMRDTAADADTVSIYGEGLPVYQTAAACQVALPTQSRNMLADPMPKETLGDLPASMCEPGRPPRGSC